MFSYVFVGKRTLKPHKFRVCNLIESKLNTAANIMTAAYGPVHEYSDVVLTDMLKKTLEGKASVNNALTLTRRRTNQEFFAALLDQLEATMQQPILVQVGTDMSKEPIKVVVLAPTWCNDNDECYMLCGCNIRSTNKRCRLCGVSFTLCSVMF